MNPETQSHSTSSVQACQSCHNAFTIQTEDFKYYTKIGVLPPKICPDCRSQLRICFRNERFLYKGICNNCKESTLSMYSPDKPYKVFCNSCWWSDAVDNKKYGVAYDPNVPFFDQLAHVFENAIRPALVGRNNIGSQYANMSADNKNCYMIVESSNNESCINCYWIQLSKELVDCSYTNKVELSYEVNDCYDSNSLRYSLSCHNCLNSYFLRDCRNCLDCLGCINLRGQKYNIFNVQYSKEEYQKKFESFKLDTHTGVEAFKKQFQSFIESKPRKFAEITNATNSTGNYLVNVKNNRHCFHAYEAEDNAYSIHVWRGAKDCMDCNTAGRSVELIYNSVNTGLEVSNVICGFHCWGAQFMEYCMNCPNSKNCFGCAGLIKASYCILNKQYSKEEYTKLRAEIIERLKREGIYGDFFPKEISPFGYNESSAMEEFPLTKDEALAQGFKWTDVERGTYGKETIAWSTFPDSIRDLLVDFDASKEVFICTNCKKNYRVITDELTFYKRMEIPIPRTCPECRHVARLKDRGPNKLWHRSCMCDLENHGHDSACPNEFETSYSPERPEIIYCESCYNKEVY